MKRDSRINERQRKVLFCAVREYILTKKPVSSERILETSDIQCSGATVRNDLRRLEYLGYLRQPHTSAGRIPTDKGFKFYVEETLKLMKEYYQPSASIHSTYPMSFGDMEKILEGAARALSKITQGAVVLEKPKIDKLKIIRVFVVPVTRHYYIMTVTTELGFMKFIPFRTFEKIDVANFEKLLNKLLVGYALEQMPQRRFEENINEEMIEIAENLVKSLSEDLRNSLIKVGLDTLINSEDFNIQEIRKLSQFFSEDLALKKVMDQTQDLPQILIGSEHGLQGLENFALFIDEYKKEDRSIGKIMVITSKVVKYEEIFSSLRYITSRLTEYFTLAIRKEGIEQ
ncbi:heat-inducible transcriptional repressor HrcA [Pseudothermotoga thermarum]|uniref:Heat-inducible transcription repressor HrcA n=1 Tax=Pseudothermotoga thermarum DSM 5069 TaxID=688269 RepID=F7YW83_9THEM|nr:heat-inducible transcriptional repressor HrcA [Pseudothermotoga thermarum]AEH51855.1 heat-inducible transcription repressor HrcA [Pseudothermotoga thermarum DSM 5069]